VRTSSHGPLSLGDRGRLLLCRPCADVLGRKEALTISLMGLLTCETCGVVGQQGPGWTHNIGAYSRCQKCRLPGCTECTTMGDAIQELMDRPMPSMDDLPYQILTPREWKESKP
jgi:hypothetical protein